MGNKKRVVCFYCGIRIRTEVGKAQDSSGLYWHKDPKVCLLHLRYRISTIKHRMAEVEGNGQIDGNYIDYILSRDYK